MENNMNRDGIHKQPELNCVFITLQQAFSICFYSTAQNRQTKHWLQRWLFIFLVAIARELKTAGVKISSDF